MTLSPETFEKASEILKKGGLVSFPTETVYGLGANALDDKAVAKIFEAKGRPQFNPLIVHLPDLDSIQRFAIMTDIAFMLADAFWPGPLTLVMKRKPDCALSRLVSAGLETVALRIPHHKTAQNLLETSCLPIAAPSANRSGHISPTLARHVQKSLGDEVDMIIDDGPCSVGLESTVLDVTGKEAILLRAGGLDICEIEKITGPVQQSTHEANAPKSPGMLLSHYAPNLPVRLNANSKKQDEALLGFGPIGECDLNLSPSGDLIEAAANLFAMMHELDSDKYTALAIAPIPEEGLGIAINDRIKRAAQPRNF